MKRRLAVPEEKCYRCDAALDEKPNSWTSWMPEFDGRRVEFDGDVYHASCFEEAAQEACMDCFEESCQDCPYWLKVVEVFGNELVRLDWGCPECGEREIGQLTNDEGTITCVSCGHVYDIG
jgi:hypothetical protein